MILAPNLHHHHQRHQLSAEFHPQPSSNQLSRQSPFGFPFDPNFSFSAPSSDNSFNTAPNPVYPSRNHFRTAVTRRYMQRTQNAHPTIDTDSWSTTSGESHTSHPPRSQRYPAQGQISGHKRTSSGSTINSSQGPSSPFTPLVGAQSAVSDSEIQLYNQLDESLGVAQNAGYIPKPTSNAALFHNNFNQSFLSQNLDISSIQNAEQSMHFHNMRQPAMLQHSNSSGDDLGRQSSQNSEFEYKAAMESRNSVPKLDRTISDIYQDELYNPHASAPSSISGPSSEPRPQRQNSKQDLFAERLQAGGHMSTHSASPAQSVSRGRSPFQMTSSQFAPQDVNQVRHNSQGSLAGSAGHRVSMAEAGFRGGEREAQQVLDGARTISPKEALLDVRDAEDGPMAPLFPSYEDDAAQRASFMDGLRGSQPAGTVEQDFTTTQPSQASIAAFHHHHQTPHYPFLGHPRRSAGGPGHLSDGELEFPAHLASMESTKSEPHDDSSSSSAAEDVARPANTAADSGTYTCTYHGCTLRFETPVKLQKHKREAHRQPSPQSEYAQLHRNSQAGPHKCERINPATGKPCNSIFSRPYDLTRHEDTIHNARKQKVRCHLCSEEKTFSRNDALTRHMRVVHPEVDFPGRSKRKA